MDPDLQGGCRRERVRRRARQQYNQWTYSAGGGPTVDGTALDFAPGTQSWSACSRLNGATPDAIGVAISYNHAWIIPTGPLFSGTITMLDKTVMVLNPTYP